jgi:hypothetical protein
MLADPSQAKPEAFLAFLAKTLENPNRFYNPKTLTSEPRFGDLAFSAARKTSTGLICGSSAAFPRRISRWANPQNSELPAIDDLLLPRS